jgi:hypothetical protein
LMTTRVHLPEGRAGEDRRASLKHLLRGLWAFPTPGTHTGLAVAPTPLSHPTHLKGHPSWWAPSGRALLSVLLGVPPLGYGKRDGMNVST